MRFFKSLFPPKKEEEVKKIRSEYKDYKYFENELKRIKEWSEDDKKGNEDFLLVNEQLTPFHYRSSYNLQENKIQILYSMYFDINVIKNEFKLAFPNFIKGYKNTPSYLFFLNVISLCILLDMDLKYFIDISDLIFNSDSKKKEPLFMDNLLIFLLNSKLENANKKSSLDNVFLPKMMNLPSKAIISNVKDAEKIIDNYLQNWYSLNKEMSWYDSHKRQWGYSGYWCWEVAAVVKIMGLDDTNFKDHPHYPYDMVHWQDA